MYALWWIIRIIVTVFVRIAGIATMIMTWTGQYKPYVDGPDPWLLMLTAMVFAHWLLEDAK